MTVFTKMVLFAYRMLLGRVEVRDKYVDSATRILRAAIEEETQASGTVVSEPASHALVQEAYRRASQAAQDRRVIWKNFLDELMVIARITSAALRGEGIEDPRVKSILEFHKVGRFR
ncbi:MAG TPA: hypothetical protein VEB66_11475 [Opitutaceae bacterium]|nr:hypothetical protein [Opitutaceae bacterium]